jgi:hypothetical protein
LLDLRWVYLPGLARKLRRKPSNPLVKRPPQSCGRKPSSRCWRISLFRKHNSPKFLDW